MADNKEKLYWEDHRLKRAVRLIIYFSTILPNKFLSFHRNDPVFEKMLRNDKKILIEDYKSHEDIFSDSYIELSEKYFDEAFNNIYNQQFLDVIFGEAGTFVK